MFLLKQQSTNLLNSILNCLDSKTFMTHSPTFTNANTPTSYPSSNILIYFISV
ncbi:hypothetical protein Hanom_Chr14g01336541 [Helianthus anomalus]